MKVKVWSFSCVQLFTTPWAVACQALLSMKFSRQGYGNRLPGPPRGNLPDPGIEPGSPALQADSLLSEPPVKPLRLPAGVGGMQISGRWREEVTLPEGLRSGSI